jgi:hypothetical protein
MKKKILFLIIFILFIIIFFETKLILKKKKELEFLKNEIYNQQLKISSLYLDLEIITKKKLLDLFISDSEKIQLKKNFFLNKLKVNGLYSGIYNISPGTGYLDFHNDNLLIVSARGILAYSNGENKKKFKQINNNIENFIGINQFKKDKSFSIKDLYILKNKIFISFTEEIKPDCWNTSLIFAEMNYEYIKFKKLFKANECIHSKNNVDNEFNSVQSGGRIVSLNDKEILFSIGEYRSRYLAQDKKSINGKIIKINIESNRYQIISIGHRNIQGLLYDENENFILATEHGPDGGDELNLINLNNNELPNYGWPIASYGEHYGKKKFNKIKYKKYPLLKSHSKNNFIEPIKYFLTTIGPSEIVKISKKSYAMSAMIDKSIYFFNLNDDNEITNINKIEVNERVRDMAFKNNKLYLFMEDSASIGIIELSIP